MNFIYSDINSFTPTQKPLLYNLDSIYQSLINLFSTRPNQRLFLPEFGFAIEDELFELIDEATSLEIWRRVIEAVERWEPRVRVDASRTEVTPIAEQHKYNLVLAFKVLGVDDRGFEFRVGIMR